NLDGGGRATDAVHKAQRGQRHIEGASGGRDGLGAPFTETDVVETEFLRSAPGQREHLRADIETRDAPARSDKSGGSKSHRAGTGAGGERPPAWVQTGRGECERA